MAQEFRTSQYWGAGEEGRWFKKALEAAIVDVRFKGSAMNFVRYAVRYCVGKDKTLRKVRAQIPSPGGNS